MAPNGSPGPHKDAPPPPPPATSTLEKIGNQSLKMKNDATAVKQPTENKMAPKGSPEPHIDCRKGALPLDTEEGTGIKLAEMKNVTSEATYVVKKSGTTLPKTIIDFAVQCHTCRKWRKLETEEHFEEFRSKHTKDRFNCNKLPGTTCEDTTNIMNYDSSRVWAMDKPNIPKTPQGFKRIVSLRNDYSRLDVQYLTPQEKKIRSGVEMACYFDKHPEFKDLSPSDFSFIAPKLMQDTVPKIVVKDQASDTKPKKKNTKNKQ